MHIEVQEEDDREESVEGLATPNSLKYQNIIRWWNDKSLFVLPLSQNI